MFIFKLQTPVFGMPKESSPGKQSKERRPRVLLWSTSTRAPEVIARGQPACSGRNIQKDVMTKYILRFFF